MTGEFTEKKFGQNMRHSQASNQSFSGSDAYQMSLLTSKLADKEKRIEECKDQIITINASHDKLKEQINVE